MLFSVIYSVDVPEGASVARYVPPFRKVWSMTEHDDKESEYSYLEGRWGKGKHRKWCAVLNRKQFDRFVSEQYLVAQNVETMGSLGAPGCGYGFSPAISFDGEDDNAVTNAYVTPLPARKNGEPIREEGCSERDWDRIRKAMLSIYG